MVKGKRNVTVQVGTNFFEKMFEPSRKNVEKQLGIKVGQAAFSEMLFKSNVKLNIKLNGNLIFNGKKKTKKNKV